MRHESKKGLVGRGRQPIGGNWARGRGSTESGKTTYENPIIKSTFCIQVKEKKTYKEKEKIQVLNMI